MTTAAGTQSDRSVLPITERYALLGWVRRNLFSDIFNSTLTLAALVFIIVIGRILLRWVFVTAEWGVIPANFNLLMRGQYPADEAWRLWLVIYMLGAVVGVFGPWGSGKTSFLNLVKHELEGESVHILEFNPWMFSGTEQLVQRFFIELTSSILSIPRQGSSVC